MRFAYEDLNTDQFEKLIVWICKELFGIATMGFATGKDGGRDAKFVGIAELFPSRSGPWKGITIIQAKHVNAMNRSCSENDFHSDNKKTVIHGEIPRIIALREKNELDHYILFTNRKVTALKEEEIRRYISLQCGLGYESVYLCGVEQIEMFLKQFPQVISFASLDRIDSPLIVDPDDLSAVIEALAIGLKKVAPQQPVERTSLEIKNQLNFMSKDYEKSLRKKYLKDEANIRSFLASPENMELQEKYQSTIDDFQQKIIAKRKDYQTFDEVMNYLFDLLVGRDPILKKCKRLTWSMLYYMYWHCDIGISEDD